jgi:hypothetical protein
MCFLFSRQRRCGELKVAEINFAGWSRAENWVEGAEPVNQWVGRELESGFDVETDVSASTVCLPFIPDDPDLATDLHLRLQFLLGCWS